MVYATIAFGLFAAVTLAFGLGSSWRATCSTPRCFWAVP